MHTDNIYSSITLNSPVHLTYRTKKWIDKYVWFDICPEKSTAIDFFGDLGNKSLTPKTPSVDQSDDETYALQYIYSPRFGGLFYENQIDLNFSIVEKQLTVCRRYPDHVKYMSYGTTEGLFYDFDKPNITCDSIFYTWDEVNAAKTPYLDSETTALAKNYAWNNIDCKSISEHLLYKGQGPENEPACVDEGMITTAIGFWNLSSSSHWDDCLDSSTLADYYCDEEGNLKKLEKKCPNGCEFNKCK